MYAIRSYYDLSEGLYVNDIVSAELKMTMRNELQTLLDNTRLPRPSAFRLRIQTITKLLQCTIDEILHSSQVMVNMIDLRTYDDYTYSHSLNVSILSVVIGITLGLNKKMLNQLALGALLRITSYNVCYTKLLRYLYRQRVFVIYIRKQREGFVGYLPRHVFGYGKALPLRGFGSHVICVRHADALCYIIV